MGLKSNQGDVTAAFIHTYISKDEEVYFESPRGFEHFSNNVCKKFLILKKMLCGLHQSPGSFWKYMIKKLEQSRLKQSKFDL